MTKDYLARWLSERNYYFLEITGSAAENPDQRISEDINFFVTTTLELTFELFERVLLLISFIGVLWTFSPIYVLYGVLYAVLSNIVALKIGGKLIPLQYEQQHREADFRFKMMKVRESREGVAFARAEPLEHEQMLRLFDKIVVNFRAIIRRFVMVETFDNIHWQVRWILPYIIAAPQIFSGAVKIGGMIQMANAFERVERSISFFVDIFKVLADWQSAIRRLKDFDESMAALRKVRFEIAQKCNAETADGGLDVRNLVLKTPSQSQINEPITFQVRKGQNLVIEGPSGVGKSTLFRAIAGLWHYFEGQIQVPSSCGFVSQMPYLSSGSLGQVLCQSLPAPVETEILKQKLEQMGLGYLSKELDREADWQKILSPGERQRISVIQILLQRPRWIFLDEATSALDQENNQRVYELLRTELPESSLVSISHNPAHRELHDHSLILRAKARA